LRASARSPTGRAEARAIGGAIRALGIPIGRVLASPFCRTRETAELIFGRATVSNAVRGGPAQADDERYAELKALLATPVAGGVDLVIVSHGNPYRAIVGGPYLAEGEAAIIEPRGKEGFRVVAQFERPGRPVLCEIAHDAVRRSMHTRQYGKRVLSLRWHIPVRREPHAQLFEPAVPHPRKPSLPGYSERINYFGCNDLDRLARTVRDHTGEAAPASVLDRSAQSQGGTGRSAPRRALSLLPRLERRSRAFSTWRTMGHTGPFSIHSRLRGTTRSDSRMEDYALQVGGRALFVESEPLVDDTAATLMCHPMARARRAVVDRYRTFRYTGFP
jgi:hypothetical protein